MSRVLAYLVAALLVPSYASAGQVDGGVAGGTTTFSFFPAQPQAPARDTTPPKPGTATLRGRVLDGDNGQPLRKAQVRVTSQGLVAGINENRLSTTDEQGRYEFKELQAGRYNLNASKGSYVALSFGQTRPFEAGKPVDIKDGQTIEKVDFALPRGAVITGRILDEFGEPISDVQVSVLRSQYTQGRRRLINVGRTGTTNDIGEFRVFALPPGQYYISATLRSINLQGNAQSDDRSGYASTYFPGTNNEVEAQRVTINVGQTLGNIDFRLIPTRTARVTGVALDADGKPFVNSMIMVTPRQGAVGGFVAGGNSTKPDGSFSISGLAPGDYTLRVMPSGPNANVDPAVASITVAGEDINDVRLVGLKPQTITGRLIVEPGVAQTLTPSTLRVNVTPVNPDDAVLGGNLTQSPVNNDLSFEVKARPGAWRMTFGRISPAADATTLAIKSVTAGSVDVTDTGIIVKQGEDIRGITIELTSLVTNLSGTVTNSRGETATDSSLVIFARDSQRWTVPGYIRTVRPDQDGKYKTVGIRPGDYYAVALDYIDPGEVGDPEFLDRIRSKATPFSLMEGETKALDLRLSTYLN